MIFADRHQRFRGVVRSLSCLLLAIVLMFRSYYAIRVYKCELFPLSCRHCTFMPHFYFLPVSQSVICPIVIVIDHS